MCAYGYLGRSVTHASHRNTFRECALQAEFERKKALAAKPEKLEEAVEKLVRWRIESEKRRLVDAYMSEVNVLRTELSAMQSGLDTTGKKGGKAK